MNAHELQLRRADKPQHETAAWFLSGSDAAQWIEELSRWQGAQSDLRLYIVPQPRAGAAGLLVIPPSGRRSPGDWRALPLGIIEGRLCLPIDAELFPAVTAAEVRALCRAELTLFHPGLGVVEFSAEDKRGLSDLLAPPSIRETNWNAGRAASPLSSRLHGIKLFALPNTDEIFGDAGEDIGAEPPTKLPPAKKEPSDGLGGKVGRAIANFGAGAVGKMLSWLPGGSSRRTWVNDAMDWATAKLASISREVEELRNRELHRLMDMLESDPERGLRHALPLDGGPGRGRAAPGTRLGTRDLRFQTGGGGGAIDPWDVPLEIRLKLTARYRELALREKQLGRFQRAAYIYAQLLGDWSSAAAVLKEGKHFTEAAVVFRDRLRQPRAAAECFELGGLFNDAIEIYEKEGLFLELGELHHRLGHEEAAAKAYRKVVQERLDHHDLVGAAGLLEERLLAPDEALEVLHRGWPGATQAAQCLTAQFALLGRLGRHDATRRRVTELRDEETAAGRVMPLAEVLADVHKTYPDVSLRPLVADIVRVKVSGKLARGDANEARISVRLLSELAPEDRLLGRDASRYLVTRLDALNKQKPPAPPPALPPPRKPGSNRIQSPRAISNFRLSKISRILVVKRCGPCFVAAVKIGSYPGVIRGDWSGEIQTEGWQYFEAVTQPPQVPRVSLVFQDHASPPGYVLVLTHPQLIRRRAQLPATDRFREPLVVETPTWLPEETAAAAISASHWWILRGSTGEWIIDIRSEHGQLIGGFPLTHILASIEEPVDSVCMLAVRSQLWIAFGRYLFQFESSGKSPRSWILETPIIGLESSARFLAPGLVARCEQGAAVFWCDHLVNEVEMIAPTLGAPYATFLGNGVLALLSSRAGPGGFHGQVIDIDRRGIQSEAEFYWKGDEPAGLVSTERQDQFAIFTRSAEVHIHEVPVKP